MVELTWVPEAIRAFFWLYVIAALVALILAMIKPKTILRRVMWSAAVVFVFVGIPYFKLKNNKTEAVRKESDEVYKAKLAIAEEAFKEHCKSSGEKISRTVDGVDGLVLMRWRNGYGNESNQFALDDPFGHDCYREGCIVDLLKTPVGPDGNEQGSGYKYLETVDPTDGIMYRYTGKYKEVNDETRAEFSNYVHNTGYGADKHSKFFSLSREPIKKFSARYGVNWQDISSQIDRENWIAGGTLEVIDMQKNEVIASRTGYVHDTGFGNASHFRSAWRMAQSNACPKKIDEVGHPTQVGFTQRFVHKVLIPK